MKFEDYLVGTRQTAKELADTLGIDVPEVINAMQCTHCGIWARKLLPDLDGHPICSLCRALYGD